MDCQLFFIFTDMRRGPFCHVIISPRRDLIFLASRCSSSCIHSQRPEHTHVSHCGRDGCECFAGEISGMELCPGHLECQSFSPHFCIEKIKEPWGIRTVCMAGAPQSCAMRSIRTFFRERSKIPPTNCLPSWEWAGLSLLKVSISSWMPLPGYMTAWPKRRVWSWWVTARSEMHWSSRQPGWVSCLL